MEYSIKSARLRCVSGTHRITYHSEATLLITCLKISIRMMYKKKFFYSFVCLFPPFSAKMLQRRDMYAKRKR